MAKISSEEYLYRLRHTASHVLAMAAREFDPKVRLAIGPAIENGFYYDFHFSKPLSEDDLPKLEESMARIIAKDYPVTQRFVARREALAQERQAKQVYKEELINDLPDEQLSYYGIDDFWDLCRGPHLKSTGEIKAFKLLSLAGAYWRGSEHNQMLTRIYGTAFPSRAELKDYLAKLEEAKKRDHRRLGTELELFMFHETAPGMPYWLPNGVKLYNELVNFWRQEHEDAGYQEIISPLLNKKELYVTSGHWDHYLENMFTCETDEGELYGLKAMNCPNAMIVFQSKLRSYRDLPLRLSDTDTLHRFERSGTLNGLLRVRAFRQDDAHIFVAEEQIKEEFERLFALVERFYKVFDLRYSFRLGTRPEKFLGDELSWQKAEQALREILAKSGKAYTVEEGDGAFYGPKIDILMEDSLGRSWQMGTFQLDFQLPKNFTLSYIDADGRRKTPVVIHRVIYGSLERFIGILIEHTAGEFPFWLAPIQVVVEPVSEKVSEYGRAVTNQLRLAGIRVELDESNETLSKRIRNAELKKVPYILVVGEKEAKDQTVTVRQRHTPEQVTMSLKQFLASCG